ncbi:MAG: HNH endonuclease [Planctomycetes bacterium]|nr:HNH endonuclease [Planctomycetota bacterium]
MNPHYATVARRAGHRCEYCRAPEVVFNFAFEVEHIVPVARGGTAEPNNLALACRSCNAYKGDTTTARDPDTGDDAPLFDPRAGRWGEHFEYDPDSGELRGLTATGRATAARLALNDPVQLTARDFWVRLRLFP